MTSAKKDSSSLLCILELLFYLPAVFAFVFLLVALVPVALSRQLFENERECRS